MTPDTKDMPEQVSGLPSDVDLRATALSMANNEQSTPEDVVDRATVYLHFLRGETEGTGSR
ncbi:hypothetical protein [Fodinicurvata sediminis]|uniref:hypothetical protein n=1 Tax=Fodinicurvata sediminis TaxID=1121832 RepID=UPI0003B2F7F1|nr:hypothetical protein [Fodinicurvata sediminis]